MSSALPSANSNRAWWSLSPKSSPSPSEKDFRSNATFDYVPKQHSKPSTFNSFASAMGFKTKKQHPSLAIQPPPTSLTSSLSSPTSSYTSSSKRSVPSMTKSIQDAASNGSPLDLNEPQNSFRQHGQARQSLLTLSDADPFAGHSVTTISMSRVPSNNQRSSASSSLAQNNKPRSDGFYFSSTPEKRRNSPGSPVKVSSSKQSSSGDSRFLTNNSQSSIAFMSKSSSPHKDATQLQSPQDSRPPLRARGMTYSGTIKRPSFFCNHSMPSRPGSSPKPSHSQSSSTASLSPRVIIRQASVSRFGLGSPPSAPPTQELPATPNIPFNGLVKPDAVLSRSESTSSNISASSSASSSVDRLLKQPYVWGRHNDLEDDDIVIRENEVTYSAGSIGTTPIFGLKSYSLKKAVSHQSLLSRTPPSEKANPTRIPEKATEKIPRKQSSFHHLRKPMPIPSSPASHTNISAASSPDRSEFVNIVAIVQRRGSITNSSLHTRKRLFSGSSSRPSISQDPHGQHSESKVRPDSSALGLQEASPFASPWRHHSSQPASLYESTIDTISSSPAQPSLLEYTPQQIMSPAKMAEVEAGISMENQWTFPSVTSPVSDFECVTPVSSSSPLSLQNQGQGRHNQIVRTKSLKQLATGGLSSVSGRPSTAQPSFSSPMPDASRPSSSPTISMTSLPPPPRPRQRPAGTVHTDHINAIPTYSSPPVVKPLRKKISVEKTISRRSVMRKPSFLDIDDETDKDADTDDNDDSVGGSFLDLARESFDTVRTDYD